MTAAPLARYALRRGHADRAAGRAGRGERISTTSTPTPAEATMHPHVYDITHHPTLAAGMAALALAIIAVAVPTQLHDASVSFSSASGARPATVVPAPSAPAARPTWIEHPLASPLDALRWPPARPATPTTWITNSS